MLSVGKLDVDSFYNRLALPVHFRPYFALPAVWSDTVGAGGPRRLVHPVLTVVPMGWSHAVLLGQAVHQHAVDNMAGLEAHRRLPGARDLLPTELVHAEYVDDLLTLEACLPHQAPTSFTILVEASQRYNDVGLRSKMAKTEWPRPRDFDDEHFTTGLGVDLSSFGVVRPGQAKMKETVAATCAAISLGWLSPRALQQLLGSWVWPLLLYRPFLAILAQVFEFARLPLPLLRRRLPAGCLQELTHLVTLGPLIEVDLHDPIASTVVAFDASKRGGGVVYSPLGPDVQELAALRTLEDWHTQPGQKAAEDLLGRLARQKWRLALATEWRQEAHINELEASTGVLALRWAARSGLFRGRRVLFLTDSRVVLGAFKKGRSSSRRLNHHCKRVAALSFVSGIRPVWSWIPTELNPADAPSRGGWIRDGIWPRMGTWR